MTKFVYIQEHHFRVWVTDTPPRELMGDSWCYHLDIIDEHLQEVDPEVLAEWKQNIAERHHTKNRVYMGIVEYELGEYKPIVLKHFCFYPPPRPNSLTDYCDVYIFPNCAREKRSVVVICQAQDYQGMSVTNGAEFIIHALLMDGHSKEGDIYVEHYPAGTRMGRGEAFDLVYYDESHVNWNPFNRNQLEMIIGQKFEGAS